MTQFFIGLAVGVGIAYLAYRAGSLNISGGVAAAILGTIIFGLGGPGWALVLLTFFISSSALSRAFKTRKAETGQNFAKGARRDSGQVAANGGVGGLLAFLFFIFQHATNPGGHLLTVLWVGFAASLAGANADTWATEIGFLNPRQPVLLTSFKRVPPGTSGGVSLVGSLAALGGSALVGGMALLSSLAGWAPTGSLSQGQQFLLITAAGFTGSLIDSLLGATIQAIYYCPICEKESERHPTHSCGAPTIARRGLAWLNNDWVNTACTFSAGLLAVLITLLL